MTPQELMSDPDFRQSKPETQRWSLKQVDPKMWGDKNDQEIDAFVTRMKPNWERETKKNQVITGQAAQAPPPAPPQAPKHVDKTMWQQAVAPVTDLVGRGMEVATEPLVPLARMMNGEGVSAAMGPESFKTVGHGGKAAETRQQAAAGVVPQSPWQAGAMGAQFIPGVGAAGPMARIGAAAAGGGGLQALLGEKGVVEGGNLKDAALEGVQGALKGAATQGTGEVLGKVLGGSTRIPFTGRNRRIANADSARVQGAVGQIAPEFAGAGKNAAQTGTFYKGTHGATEAASGAFKGKLSALEAELNKTQGHPFINTPELVQAYRQVVKSVGKDPVLGPQMAALAPSPQGFLPEQAAKIVSLTGQRLGANTTGLGHLKDQAMDDLVSAVERSLPASAQGMLTGARSGYARAMGLQELLAPSYTAGKGYAFDIRKLQQALSEDPSLLNRLGKSELEQLFAAATRGASKGPGWADKAPGNMSVPYPSQQGAMVAALRNLMTRGRHVGELPGTLPQGAKAGLGVATTAATSVKSRRDKE